MPRWISWAFAFGLALGCSLSGLVSGPPGQATAVAQAPPEAPLETHRLEVRAIPWAKVEIDGVPKGTTAWWGELEPGPHEVTLTYKDQAVTRTIVLAEEIEVVYDFHDGRWEAP